MALLLLALTLQASAPLYVRGLLTPFPRSGIGSDFASWQTVPTIGDMHSAYPSGLKGRLESWVNCDLANDGRLKRCTVKHYAGLDVSQQTTSIFIVDEEGSIVSERKVAICPDAIAAMPDPFAPARAGPETGLLSVWLWNELKARGVPTCMDEAANALLTRIDRFSALKSWGLRIAKRGGFKRAKVAVARKLATMLHATWKTGDEFRWSAEAQVKAA